VKVGRICEATHDLPRKGRRIRTRCIVTVSWPSRAADRTIWACGILLKMEKLRRSNSGLDIVGVGRKWML
jgi:hypothetical protein